MNKVINSTSLNEKIRLDKSYNNYNKIINKNLPYKFSYLNEWLLKKSKILMKEANNLILQNIELGELKKPCKRNLCLL